MSVPTDRTAPAGERRTAEREELTGTVAVLLAEPALVGPGRDISARGVYLTTAAPVVRVQVADEEGFRTGRLVRIESLGDGRVGIAVQFDG